LAVLGVVTFAASAQAQFFVGFGRDFGYGGWRGGYAGWGQPYYGGYYGGYYGYPSRGWSFSIGSSPYYHGGYYSPYHSYSAPFYTYSAPSYSMPGYGYGYSSPVYTYSGPGYAAGEMRSDYQSFYGPSGMDSDKAYVRVILPNPEANLWIGDTATQQRGFERIFVSPPIEANRDYRYHLRATWREGDRDVTRERDITVRAGRETVVDLAREEGTRPEGNGVKGPSAARRPACPSGGATTPA
jgi:uncharacterized protein (TIGR03000 family)